MSVAGTSAEAASSHYGVDHSIDDEVCHQIGGEPVADSPAKPGSSHGDVNQSIVDVTCRPIDDKPEALISDSLKLSGCGTSAEAGSSQDGVHHVVDDGSEPYLEQQVGSDDNCRPNMEKSEGDPVNFTGTQKRLFELRLKMNEARKSNQVAVVAEKKRMEAPTESRGISKQKWVDSRKKKIGRLLEANGLDMKNAFMLDTQEMAESKYKKWEKDPAPCGWDVFNQKTLYSAYKKRAKNIKVDLEEYNRMKEADPEFYRDASSLQYGKRAEVSEEKVEMMVKELKDRDEKRKSFSRRRRFHEEKDIDSINDRNEHFNKKIERAFGKYTLEIKNNLERGTALPD